MNVLKRYFEIIEEAGEDLSTIESHAMCGEDIGIHSLRKEFNDGHDWIALDFWEEVEISIDNEKFPKIPVMERYLVNQAKIIPIRNYIILDFVYEDVGLEHAVTVDIDSEGKVKRSLLDENKSSFYLHEDAGALRSYFGGLDTSVGVDFEPIVKAMVSCYQNMKERPEHYSRLMSGVIN